MPVGGGTIAAYGLRYQYLVTIEVFLQHLRNNLDRIASTDLLVEPLLRTEDGTEDDIVDFGFLTDGTSSHRYQVKSSLKPEENPLTPAPAKDILQRLSASSVEHAALYTNRLLSTTLEKSVSKIDTVELTEGTAAFLLRDGTTTSSGLQPVIYVDTRTEQQIRKSICSLIRQFRKEQQLSQGELTCNSLVSLLIDHIFSAAAETTTRKIGALEVIQLLAMPDNQIAQVVGGFDWGRVVANLPHYPSTTPRIEYLNEIRESLHIDSGSTIPSRTVLIGHTGAGKSVIAADYSHVDAGSFAFIFWLDSRDAQYLESQALDLYLQLTHADTPPTGIVATAFASAISGHPGPWLIVFDGATDRATIEPYLPTHGNGGILVTTNNSLNWWPDCTRIDVCEFNQDQAVSCFCSYANIDESNSGAVGEIVETLGRVPLAVAMAGIYFANGEGTVSELSKRYFEDLAALDDPLSIPPGFNETAFKAIQHAVRKLGTVDPRHGRKARAALEMGSLLAPEQIPLNLVLQATDETVHVDVARPPSPSEVPDATRRGVVAALRTQSIANRTIRTTAQNSPTNDTITLHPLIHHILQASRLDSLPPGVFEQDSTVFMHYCRGWLGRLRADGDFLGADQIRMHAEAVLAVISQHEPLRFPSDQHRRIFLITKALLLTELSTCHASRRRYTQSIELIEAASVTLQLLGSDPVAHTLQLPLLVNTVHDMSFLHAPDQEVQPSASRAIEITRELTADAKPAYQNIGYVYARELRLWITRTPEYRASELLKPLADALSEIIASDPAPNTRPNILNDTINRLYDTRSFHELHALADGLLQEASPSDEIGLIALRAVASMHIGEVAQAISDIDRLLSLEVPAQYLRHEMVEAMGKVARELQMIANNGTPPIPAQQLVSLHTRIRDRIRELETDHL
ncbi:hypothetical protein [Dietzia natronolimnaea]|uniref:hypothetical protein n=1 Tax=Dietzia natronolimnaea TaxID=161920 RepID=UPI0015F82C88|nr:hypothetical protein [Dietzia natronolimnaea]MBB1036824.1 hypothetical protein [Dietzia natronolimnaea]